MSHDGNTRLLESLYEQYLDELQNKYYGGINPELDEPWFHKTDQEIEEEAAELAQKHFEAMAQ
jgi:ferritin-like protein